MGQTLPTIASLGSLLSEQPSALPGGGEPADRSYASDLHLDQIISSIVRSREEPELLAELLYRPVHSFDTIHYRQEVFADLEDERLRAGLESFAAEMRQVRRHLGNVERMHSQHQQEGWLLDAAAIYCRAVRALVNDLAAGGLRSRALRSFGAFLTGYTASEEFTVLEADTTARKQELGRIDYDVRIRGSRVEVSRYDGEADYSAEVEETFARFAQGEVRDYRVTYRGWPAMDHVGAQILDLVARLFAAEFAALADFCARHRGFVDGAVRRFERELHFYLAYLSHIVPLRDAGLPFCYPQVGSSKDVFAADTFDLALAAKLVSARAPVVTNDVRLCGVERVLVVSGPNQGGKTTFARTFGQLHHLGAVGCPVPGSASRLFLFDRLFTHFEREEDLANLTGKLEDDLIRIGDLLERATPASIVILNEIFTSTTLRDARFLGGKLMEVLIELDLLAVWVTFVDELASFGGSVVSMVSTIVPENPAQRTYKVVREPADGLAYALAIAEKHGLTYERMQKRLAR